MSFIIHTTFDIKDLISKFSLSNHRHLDNYFKHNDIYEKKRERCYCCPAIEEYDIFDTIFKESLSKIKDFFGYCFLKEYLIKNDYTFQNRIATIVSDINHWAGMCTREETIIFHWSVHNLLTEDTLKTFRKKDDDGNYTETIFHQLFNANCKLSNKYMKDMFTLFDKINFNYSIPSTRSLLVCSIYGYDTYSINELIKRGLTVSKEELVKCITFLIKRDLCPLKYYSENDYKKRFLLDFIYSKPELIVKVFKDVNTKELSYIPITYDETGRLAYYLDKNIIDEIRSKLMWRFNKNDDEEDMFYNILTIFERKKLVRPLYALKSIYYLLFTIKKNGYDIKQFLYLYLNGSGPIELLNPEMHIKFIELFTT
jgi:hypothetical protein